MPYIFKQTIFILICLHYYSLTYNNFNELKSDMEMKVSKLTDAIQNIYSDKCNVNSFQCPVKSFNVCDGTDHRICINSFPVAPTCPGVSKYSMTSGIRIPNSVASFNLSDQMKFFICKTAETPVQSVLQQLIMQDDKKHAWISLASSLGVSRISPGFKYQKQNATASCKNYDPRLRPWYSQSTYGRKKMIILIQNSKGIYEQPNRFASMQMSLQAILKTSQPDDLFNIIQFSDSPRLFFSEKQMKLVSLSAQIRKFQKANNNSGSFFESVANNITKSKSILANYKKALELALKVFENSVMMNPEMQNFILFFAGFKPTNLTADYSSELATMLTNQQSQWSTNFLFFGFGVTMHDTQGTDILSQLACKHDGIYIDLTDITYESMFVDQAQSYYDYLTQGNQIKGCRWTSLYEDALGLGKMVSVIKPCYYQQSNVSKLIGVVAIDVLVKQLTAFMTFDQIQKYLQVTKLPFKKNISLCVLQNIRGKNRCYKPELINCTVSEICTPLINPLNQSVIRKAIDTSQVDCCVETYENYTGVILGIVLGSVGAVFLVALAVYCLIFRRRKKTDLQKTYAEIFSQFKDFDRTRIRSDSEISIIKD